MTIYLHLRKTKQNNKNKVSEEKKERKKNVSNAEILKEGWALRRIANFRGGDAIGKSILSVSYNGHLPLKTRNNGSTKQ